MKTRQNKRGGKKVCDEDNGTITDAIETKGWLSSEYKCANGKSPRDDGSAEPEKKSGLFSSLSGWLPGSAPDQNSKPSMLPGLMPGSAPDQNSQPSMSSGLMPGSAPAQNSQPSMSPPAQFASYGQPSTGGRRSRRSRRKRRRSRR
jgi:hypothetical protein